MLLRKTRYPGGLEVNRLAVPAGWRVRAPSGPRHVSADGEHGQAVADDIGRQDLERIGEPALPTDLGCRLPPADDGPECGQDL